MDEKDFFIGATQRICSSLEIEKALWKCLMYIRDYIPADYLYLVHHDLNYRNINIIAAATVEGGSLSIAKFPMASDYFKWLDTLEDVWFANDVESHYMMKHYLNYINPQSSYLNARLIVEDQFIGSLLVEAKGKNRFTEDHAKIMALLKEPFAIALANSLKHLELLKLRDRLKDDNKHLQNELLRISSDHIIGKDDGLRGVMEAVNQVSHLATPVLLIGDTGSGKEVIANAIHNLSPRKDGPFIKVNCGAIPESVIDSELFGHEKGAFTGAIIQKQGHFERAHEGTILLDEIGELPPDAQLRMLRVIQDKEIYRVGGSKPVKVNIRLIAATHRNLEDLVKSEKFRGDLYFRLMVFPIIIPPLKQRKGDITNLTHYFVEKKTQEMGITDHISLAPGALDDLINYDWPGNVRELENAIERALILRKGRFIDFKNIINPQAPAIPDKDIPPPNQLLNMDQIMAKEIAKVLMMTGGKVEGKNGAAEVLGIKPNTLRSRMRKMGIPFGRQPGNH